MPTINDLSSVSAVSDSDQIPLFASGSQTTRRATIGQLRDTIEEGLSLPDGELSIAGFYFMRGQSASAMALTTTPQAFTASQFSLPSSAMPAAAASFQADPANGRFIALRDVQLVKFWFAVTGTWPTNRELTAALLLGDQTTPFTSDFQFVGAGAGATVRTAIFSGVDTNRNDSLNFIRAGQTVRPVVSLNVADTLNVTRIAFALQTADGL